MMLSFEQPSAAGQGPRQPQFFDHVAFVVEHA